MDAFLIRIYKPLSLAFAAIFAAVGLLFLLVPGGVVAFFNQLSVPLGLQPSPPGPTDFFLTLAVAYMAVVTFLAGCMFRNPADAAFPRILAVAKISSSVLSFLFFFLRAPFLMYLANAVVDGLIGVIVILCHAALSRHAAPGRRTTAR
jgi:hypothetical protein